MDSTTAIGVVLAALITLCTAYKGISSLITEPVTELKLAIQGLTAKFEALEIMQEKTETKVSTLSDKVDDHEKRITILETQKGE